ncbi:MAG: IS21 family transposase [Chitinivibrionales bacterium]|nr:IS21 family transposase [Chitinivibrionales bacterium]
MPERKSMRRIKECLRLHFDSGLSQNVIAGALKVARSTVWDYLRRAKQSGQSWEELRKLSDEELEVLLFSRRDAKEQSRPVPDWEKVHKELHSHSYITMQLLWEEYLGNHPDGYSYPRYCVLYREWAKRYKVYKRQRHIGGEKLFVDYSGKKPHIRNIRTGEDQAVELFVMAWGASHYIYAEAHESQQLPDWTMGHRRGYEYFGCVPHIEVDDNLKSAVTKACRYDPDLNTTFTEFAEYYGVAIIPARPKAPKDKAKVENAVLIAQRWILARLRNRVFYSLVELNREIRILVEKLNDRPMQKLPKSRRRLFHELDKPNALPLPLRPFEYREWYYPTVAFDYHVEVDKNFYSVPWILASRTVSVRLTKNTVEVLHKGERVALHQRSNSAHHYTTLDEHMPPAHQKHIEWNPTRLYKWAEQIGPNTHKLIQKVIKTKFHPQQGFRPAVGILRLAKTYGNQRLESAAAIALKYTFLRVRQIRDLLRYDKDKGSKSDGTVVNTQQVRGKHYYAKQSSQQILPL